MSDTASLELKKDTKVVREETSTEYYFDYTSVYIYYCSCVWVRQFNKAEEVVDVRIEDRIVINRFNLKDADKLRETLNNSISRVHSNIDTKIKKDKRDLENASIESNIDLYK